MVCILLCGADSPLQVAHTVPVPRSCVHSSLSNGLQRRVRVLVAPAVTRADLRLRLKGRLCLTSACRTCCASITVCVGRPSHRQSIAQILVCALLCGADLPLQVAHTVPVLRRCVHSSLSNGLQRRVRVIDRTGSKSVFCHPDAARGALPVHIRIAGRLPRRQQIEQILVCVLL